MRLVSAPMLKKIAKPLLIILFIAVLFVVLVVIFVDSDEEGRIRIAFPSSQRRISDAGFNELIEREIDIANLSTIDWADKYNEALSSKYDSSDESAKASQKTIFSEDDQVKSKNARESFADYLKESDAQLDGEQNPLKLALEYRDAGQGGQIDSLIKELDEKVGRIEKILPSEEIIGYHLVKLRIYETLRARCWRSNRLPRGFRWRNQ